MLNMAGVSEHKFFLGGVYSGLVSSFLGGTAHAAGASQACVTHVRMHLQYVP